jgi:hypothetical protein
MRLQRRGRRTLIMTPEGMAAAPKRSRDEIIIKALLRAHWWRRIECGEAKSASDLAGRTTPTPVSTGSCS